MCEMSGLFKFSLDGMFKFSLDGMIRENYKTTFNWVLLKSEKKWLL